jgi:hypothetical protein
MTKNFFHPHSLNKRSKSVLTGLALVVCMNTVLVNASPPAFAEDQQKITVVQNSGNDGQAIQKAIDEATAKNGIAYLPAGEYKLESDLWLETNSVLQGAGDKTVLHFSKGQIRSLKNDSKEFHYTNNYINEVTPQAVKATLDAAPVGATTITADTAARFAKGDWIYTDDNRKDTWDILEDQKKTHQWNDPATPLSRQQIFQIVAVQGNVITLNTPLQFALEKGASLYKHVGARNFEVSSLKIISPTQDRPILCEQPMGARFLNLTIEAKGGITLTHKPYDNLIQNCRFITTAWRGVTVEYFGAKNRVLNNEIEYVTGGDCALLFMVSCSDNDVAYNTIRHIGPNVLKQDEGGIYIHATSFHNTVHHNNIDGTLEALGSYYGAEDNLFFENVGTNVRMGVMSYYARNNTYLRNHFSMVPKPPVNPQGAVVYGSYGSLFKGNRFTGEFHNGIVVQGSHDIDILDNTMVGAGAEKSEFGIRFIGKDTKTGDDFNGANPRSGLRRGNTISNIKTPEGT